MSTFDVDQRELKAAIAATGIACLLASATWFIPQEVAAKAIPGVTCLAGVAGLVGLRFGWRTRRHFAARLTLAVLLLLFVGVTWRFLSR